LSAAVRAWAIAALTLKPNARQPLFIVLISLLPLSFFLVFRLIGGRELSQHALYGIIVVFATNAGVISLPQIAVSYRTSRLQEMYVASPVGPGLYALGIGLSRLLFALPPIVLVLGLLVAGGGMRPASLPLAAAVVACTAFTGIMAGFAIALLVPDIYLISSVANMLGLLLTVIPPVYYPLALVPAGLRWLPLLTPTANAAQLLRVLGGAAASSPGLLAAHWAILLGEGAICAFVVFRRMRWQER
jgi:ABC-2 type transport system permease protein